MHDFNPRRLDAIEWASQIELFCQQRYPRIKKAATCRMFNVAIHLLLDLPDEGELHEKNYPIIWNQVKRTRNAVIMDKKSRNREKGAAILSYFGEKALKFVWGSKMSIRRKEE